MPNLRPYCKRFVESGMTLHIMLLSLIYRWLIIVKE
ncbi:Uncharacterised protein [Burkholderia pseudomallei]|nr:Uncharacterised protein [Burkholderia pseudomallei]